MSQPYGLFELVGLRDTVTFEISQYKKNPNPQMVSWCDSSGGIEINFCFQTVTGLIKILAGDILLCPLFQLESSSFLTSFMYNTLSQNRY